MFVLALIFSLTWYVAFSGPKLTLSNTDRNIATATGDIKVGIYVFKLTVYDMQGQTGSTTLKITVKQSM